MKPFFLLIGLLILTVSPLTAQSTMTPEWLWQLGRVSLEDVSPDESQLLYGVTYFDMAKNKGNRDLYLMDLSNGNVQRLTQSTASEYNARFRPDGKKIGFLREGSLFEITLSSGQESRLGFDNVQGFAYSPQQDQLLFVYEVKMEPSITDQYKDLPKANAHLFDDLMYRHWDSWTDYKYAQIFVLPYQDGLVEGTQPVNIIEGPYDAPLKPFGGMEQINWSPDGRYIAYTCKKLRGKEYAQSTNSDIFLYDTQTGETTNLSRENPGYDMEPVFSPNGRYIAWNSMATPGFESDRNRVMLYDRKSGDLRELTPGLDRSLNHPQWSPDSKYMYCTGGVEATYQLFSIDVSEGTITQLTKGVHNYYDFHPLKSGDLIASRASMSMPHELYRVEGEKGSAQPLTDINKDELEQVEMGNVEQRWIPTTDGQKMLTWIIYPPGFDKNKKYPALLYCQGGPQSAVSQFWSYRWNFQMMASQGYVVVAPNRRGLPGFGRAWNDQISGDWGGQAMEDLLAAIDAVKVEPYVDEDRLGAVGASFGGYSVYWLAGNHQKRFKAFIAHCGLFNLESWYGTTEELFFANQDLEGSYWQEPVPETYQKDSPHLYVQNWDTPLLVIHNGRDFRVPLAEGMQAFQAAQLQGVPSQFLYFPEENHWVLTPQNGILWQRVFFDWLDQWLKEGKE